MRAGLLSNQWKRERVDAYRICVTHSWVYAHNNEYTFNSLLVLQLFPLWVCGSGRVGSKKPDKLTGWIESGRVGSGRVTALVGRVGSGNFEPRATLWRSLYTGPRTWEARNVG